jgi:CRISPR-associated protein Csm3
MGGMKIMRAKLEIKGRLSVLTGMHIGGSDAFAAIGAVDSPVVRDPVSNLPMIPGSSIKGKIRALLAQQYNDGPVKSYDQDAPQIVRLFGSAQKGGVKCSRLLFRDMILDNVEELRAQGAMSLTEVKFENNINRLTAVANPRQIERVIRGSKFSFSIIYNVEDPAEAQMDLGLLAEGMRLLQYDYLGGHGSRGYGRVQFSDLTVTPVVGSVANEVLTACQVELETVLKDVG